MFWWDGINAFQLGFDTIAGGIRTYDAAGTGYVPFAAAQIESKSGGVKFPDGTIQITAAASISSTQTPWLSNIDGAGYYLHNAGYVRTVNGTHVGIDSVEVHQYGSGIGMRMLICTRMVPRRLMIIAPDSFAPLG